MTRLRQTGRAALATLLALTAASAQQLPSAAPAPRFDNSPRVHELIRAGNLYLSFEDALSLAIENNLDIELQRYVLPAAEQELKRTEGGGLTRGLNYTILEMPAGVGGPLSPVVTGAATGRATAGGSVQTNALGLTVLNSPQTNLSIQGTVPQSTGTSVPLYDTALVGQSSWTHTSAPQSTFGYGINSLATNTAIANAGIQRGFSTGAQAAATFNNNRQSSNALTTLYGPYAGSSLGVTFTQPLLRGFGRSLNRRFIRIASNERRIASLVFRQQLIATVYGVIRLYTDYVALWEDEKVKRETVDLAEKLLSDVRAQVEEGTLAPVESTRASAQVFSTRQDLINASGLREEQEALLKNVLTRSGNADPEVRAARIIPTSTLDIPADDGTRPIQDLAAEALAGRPDLGQARLQVENSRVGLEGARSATLPQIDLVGTLVNNGLAGSPNPLSVNNWAAINGGYADALGQVLARNYPTYGVGVQVTLPLHNRVAEADLARDELQVRQSEVRLRQMENQARLEVEDALIAMGRARASYQAAAGARKLQEESLAAEQARFEVGASTSFFVIQYQSLVAQAKSTEVAARSSYVKARAALARATGTILERNHIEFDAAVKGRM